MAENESFWLFVDKKISVTLLCQASQQAAKVLMKTDTNISRKYYLARKIASQIYLSEVSTNIPIQ